MPEEIDSMCGLFIERSAGLCEDSPPGNPVFLSYPVGRDSNNGPRLQNGLRAGHRIPVSVHIANRGQDRGASKTVFNGPQLPGRNSDRLLDKKWYARFDCSKLKVPPTERGSTDEKRVDTSIEQRFWIAQGFSARAFLCERFSAADVFVE